MAITFNEGFYCVPSLVSPQGINTIDLDRGDSFFNGLGDIVAINSLGNGRINPQWTNVSTTAQIMMGFHGLLQYNELADWYGDYPTKPMNICVVPFSNQVGDMYYLVLSLGVLTRNTISGGIIQISYNCALSWATDPEDVSTFTTIRSIAAGSMTSDGYPRPLMLDVCFLRNEVFAEGLSLEDFPLYDYAIFFYTQVFAGTTPETPSLRNVRTNAYGYIESNPWTMFSVRQIALAGYGRPAWVEDSPEVGPASEEGGYDPDRPGAFDNSSDDIALPSDPTLGVSNVGFVRVYNTGLNQLTALGLELFPPLAYTPPAPIADNQSVSEAIVDGFNQIVTFLANIPSFFDQFMANTLINYVIDCHMIPVSPGAGSSEAIHVGPKTLTTTAGRIYKDYVNFSCGSISVGEYYGNFADFYANAKLYLPFVGFVPTRPEWFTGGTLSIDYKFNVIDGSFCAYVRAGGKHVGSGGSTIVGQYAGNACVHLPITGPSYASMVSGLVGAGSGMIAGAASGNIAAVATSAIGAMTSHGDIASSNAYNGSAAFLSCRVPFLMIERPVSSWAKNYQHEIGIPANVYAKLGDVPGYVRMENVHIDGVSGATEAEKNEIARLLAQGVIV